MTFVELPEFKKDLKRMSKKYKTINEDLAVVKSVLQIFPGERPPFSFRIDNLHHETTIIKVKKIASKSIKGKGVNTGLRLIYAYFPKTDKIVLIEIYHKNEKENENRERITDNFR